MESQDREPTLEEMMAALPPKEEEAEPTLEEMQAALPQKEEAEPTLEEMKAALPPESNTELEAMVAALPDISGKRLALKNLAGWSDDKADEIMAQIQEAEAERRGVLENIAKNEAIESEVKKLQQRGADSAEIETFKRNRGYVYRNISRELAENLSHLGKGESTYQSDVERAYDPRGPNISPIRGVGGIVSDISSQGFLKPWTWNVSTWGEGFTDKDARKRVKEEISQPIVDDNGFVNPMAVNQSSLPRTTQNALMSIFAKQRTGISREIWEKVLTRAGGVTDEHSISVPFRRAFQMADSFFGAPSWASLKTSEVSDRLEDLKKGKPGVPINLQEVGGKLYANGVEVKDAEEGDTPEQLQQKGWAALVDNTKGIMHAQATENWTQLATMLIPGLGELSAIAKGAKLGKVAKGLGVLDKITAPVTRPLSATANLVAPQKFAMWAVKNPKKANLLMAADKMAGVGVTMPAASAAFAPEDMEVQAAAGTLALGIPMGALTAGHSLLKAVKGSAVHPMAESLSQGKTWKRIRVTPDENALPKYIKNVFIPGVKPKEQSYADMRQNNITLYKFADESWKAMDNLLSGATGPEQIAIFMDTAGRDPQIKKMAVDLSTVQSRVYLFDQHNQPLRDKDGNPQFLVKMGITPLGRGHARVMNMIGVNTDKVIADKKTAIQAGVASAESEKLIKVFEILKRKFNNAAKEAPPEILNDRPKFLKYVRGNIIDIVDSVGQQNGLKENSLKAFADEINDMVTGTDPEFEYTRFVSDVMKLWAPIIDAGQSLTPTQKMNELLGFIANPPEIGMDFDLLSQKAATPPTIVNDLAGNKVVLQPLSHTATAKQFLQSPGVLRDVIIYSQGLVGQYHGLKGSSSLKSAREAYKAAKMEVEDVRVKRRTQTTLNKAEVTRQLTHVNDGLTRTMQGFVDDKKVKVRVNGKTQTTTIPSLIARIEGALSDTEAKSAAKEITPQEANAVGRARHQALESREQIPEATLKALPEEYRSMFVEANRLNANRARLESHKSVAELQLKRLEEDETLYRAKTGGSIRERSELLARGVAGKVYDTKDVGATTEFFRSQASRADTYGVFKTRYGDNVLKITAAKIANSWDGASFHLDDPDAGFVRLMADEDFARNIMKLDIPTFSEIMEAKKKDKQKYLELKRKRSDWGKAQTDIVRLADYLSMTTRNGDKLRRQTTDLDKVLAQKRDNLPAANAILKYMRDTYNISRMSRELVSKKLGQVMDLAERLAGEGKVYRPADVKLMAWMASSNMVNRFRIEHPDTPYLITYQHEVDNIFRVMRDTVPEIAKIGIESVAKTLKVPSDTLSAAVISGWFINPRSTYDGAGYLRTTLEAAYWWKNESARGNYSNEEGEFLRACMLEETNANLFSRAHAIDVSTHVSSKAVGTLTAKRVADEFLAPFHRELEGLKVGGRSYLHYQSRKPFVDVMKKLMYGHSGRTDYLVVPEIGAGGKVTHRWTDTGKVLLSWLDNEVKFKEEGADRSSDSLRATVNKAAADSLPPGATPEQVALTKAKYDRIYRSILTYWNVKDADYDTYKMAFNALRVIHDYDYKRVVKFNELNAKFNKEKGTRYANLEWFPYRLEAGTQLLSELQVDPDNLAHPALMKQMFGRSIASSEQGQLAKCQAISGVDSIMMHPQEAFDVETTRLFQGVHTRDAMRRLYELAILLNDAGFNGAARLLTASYIGVEKELRANAQSLITSLADRGLSQFLPGDTLKTISNYTLDPVLKYGPRGSGILFDTMMMLRKVSQAYVENPAQFAVTSFGNNPKNLARTLEALSVFYPKVAARSMRVVANTLANIGRGMVGKERYVLTEQDLMNVLTFARRYSPAYAEARVRLLQGMNGVKDSRLTQARKRITWEVNRGMKGVDKVVGDRVAGFYDWIGGLTKEMSEFTLADISIGQAMSIWERGLESARATAGRPFEERARAVYDVLHTQFEGTFGNEVAAWKTSQALVKGLDGGAPLAAFEGFAAEYVFHNVGRFDSKNMPKALARADRIVPGTSEFFVPKALGLYRLGQSVHGALSSGVNPTHAGVAALATAATFGSALALVRLASTSGIGWFNRIQSVPGMEAAFGEGAEEELKRFLTPNIKAGRMQHTAWLSAVMAAIGAVAMDQKAAMDGTLGTEEHEKAVRERNASVFDSFLKMTPGVLITDIIKSPARYGFLQFFADPEEIQEMVAEVRAKGQYQEDGRPWTPETDDPMRRNTVEILDMLSGVGGVLSEKWMGGNEVTPEEFKMILGKYGKLLPEATIQDIMEEWQKREKERVEFETRQYLYGDQRVDEKTQRK